MPSNEIELRLNALEEWRRQTETLLTGSLSQAGVVPLLVSLAEVVRGKSGEAGLVKLVTEHDQMIREAKATARATIVIFSLLGTALGGLLSIAATHFFK